MHYLHGTSQSPHNRKGQGIVEYILAFVAVVVVLVGVSRPGGIFSTRVEDSIDEAVRGTDCMTRAICYDPAGCPAVTNCTPIPTPPPPPPPPLPPSPPPVPPPSPPPSPPPPVPPTIDCGTAPSCPSATGSGTGTTPGSTYVYNCIAGYTGTATTISCNTTGSWTGNCPTCTLVASTSCGAPLVCPFATSSGTGTNQGDTQTYSCIVGYTGVNTTSTCNAGNWSINCPACIIEGCGPPPSCPGTSATGSGTTAGDTRNYTCNNDPTSTSTIICNALDFWAGSCPTCSGGSGSCGGAPTCPNSTPAGTGTSTGDTRIYRCNPGFTGTATTIVCNASGIWSGSCPYCIGTASCGPAPICPNTSSSGTGTLQGDTWTYTCNSGFNGTGTTVTCNSQGTWSGSCPTCTAGSCGAAPTCANATGSGTGFNEGDVQAYTCDVGFGGSATTFTCTSGSWVGSCPICVAGSCGPAPTCPNSTGSGSGTTAGSTWTYTCDAGYSGTSTTLTCDPLGFWLGSCPVCSATTCGPAPTCPNSTSGGGGTAPGDTQTYTCDPGYTGSSATITCNALGSWSGPCPTCTVNSCGSAPACANALASGSGSAPGDTRIYTCNPGYTGTSVTMTCTGSSWTGSCPSCVLNGCGLPPQCTNATASGSGTTSGSAWTYTCNAGYTGTPTVRTCQASGTWDSFCPSCTLVISCGPAPICSNATATGGGTSVGDNRVYNCDTGYIGSSTTIVCGATGTWTGSCPACNLPSSCGPAPVCPYSSASGTGMANGDTRTYTCDTGFIGTTQTMSCNNGTWGGQCPACTVTGCGPQPTCPNSISSPGATANDVVYTCITNGSSRTITCTSGGYWSGPCPSC